jgi:shikimate kinase
MSNAGKSYRSGVLERDKGFLRYCVDDEILKSLGLESEEAISSWMGYPSNAGYAQREQEYLKLEDTYTKHASMHTHGQNIVFDTTGSVVHLPQETLALLQDNCLVVHLEIDEARLSDMVEKFFRNPKPVAWSGYFSINPGESEHEALRRCYPILLKERLARYKQLAHVYVPVAEVRDTRGDETLAAIRRHL